MAWWGNMKINALEIAKGLWEQTHAKGGQVNQRLQPVITDASETTTKN
jgi:hypothetical protein